MNQVLITTFETLVDQVPVERRLQSQEYWSQRSLSDVMAERPEPSRYGNADIVVIDPDNPSEIDETQTLVVSLEFLQGYTPAHYIRAKVMQQYVYPNSRVLLLPQSTFGMPHIDTKNALTSDMRKKMSEGDFRPYGEISAKSIEELIKSNDYNLGTLMLSGFSQGALTALAIAGKSSDVYEVGGVVAIEPVSKSGRDLRKLAPDYLNTGGNVNKAVRASGIQAQSEAMNWFRTPIDFGRFGARLLLHPESLLLARAMTGSANYLVNSAVKQLPEDSVSVYFIPGSRMFDPESISPEVAEKISIISAGGVNSQGHVTMNNLPYNGAMTFDGLVRR